MSMGKTTPPGVFVGFSSGGRVRRPKRREINDEPLVAAGTGLRVF